MPMYHVSVHKLAERLLSQIWRGELLRAGDRLGVAVSGGIDSLALLRLLIELRPELGIVLSVVHFNHKLRAAEADADQQFVEKLAGEFELEFHSASGDVAQHAADEHSSVEAAARELRYRFFDSLLNEDGSETGLDSSSPHLLDKIATGHTLDDQAETVLMRLIRGTGLKGIGGIYPRILVENEDGDGHGEIIRPLLGIRRSALEQYLADIQQPWREDSTNSDSKFTRNRVRKIVLPLLERQFNPAVVAGLAELAEIARDEEDYWENEVSGWLGTVVQWSQPEWTRGLPEFGDSPSLVQILPSQPKHPDPQLLARLEEPGPAVANASVSRPWLLTEPRAVQRRVLKAIGQQAGIPLEFKHIEEILRVASEDGPPGKELSLPLGWKVVREAESIVFVTPDLRRNERVPDFEYTLPVPGRVFVGELGVVTEALHVGPELRIAEYNPQQLLRAGLLPKELTVRNWRPGDRFWPAHTGSPKKVKELLQERHVPQPARRLWPVIVNGDEIVWMRGFPVPANWHATREQEAILIRETPWAEDESAV
jgi:tRNA(Ile)-lysidine synthase